MSVEPQALERSVLERKERDELAAIAEAMGVKANSRTSKANLIEGILREAGVELAEEKPKRGKTAKADANGGEQAAATSEPEADADATSEPVAEVQADQQSDEAPKESDDESDVEPPQSAATTEAPAPRQDRQGGRRPRRQGHG